MIPRTVVTFAALCVIWLFWSGLTIEIPTDGGSVGVNGLLVGLGLGSCLLVTWLSHRLQVLDAESQPFHLSLQVILFIPWLLREVWKSNVAVAKVVLARKVQVRPKLMRVRASQGSNIGQVIHANTITLTPGTLTLDLRDGVLLVHALTDTIAGEEDSVIIDERVTRLERGDGEPAK